MMNKKTEITKTTNKFEKSDVMCHMAAHAITTAKDLEESSMTASADYIRTLADTETKEYELLEKCVEKASSFDECEKILKHADQMRKEIVDAGMEHDKYLKERQETNNEHVINVLKIIVSGLLILGGVSIVTIPHVRNIYKR